MNPSTRPWKTSPSPCSRVAVVGPSGSGKNTISHLALRFWDAQRGEVSLGGRNVRAYSRKDLRDEIGLVPRETRLFN